MKNILLVLFTIGFFAVNAQDKLDKVTNKLCEKFSTKDLSGINDMSAFTEELGGVMLEVIADLNKKELKKLEIDLTDPQSLEKFGETIGKRLAATCEPFEQLIAKLMAQDDSELLELVKEQEGIESTKKFGEAEGKIISISQIF